jgi:fluoroquinolone resistance protein
MSEENNVDQRLAQTMEKIRKSIEQKSRNKLTSEKNVIISAESESLAISKNEENLIISPGTTLISNREFVNLDWIKKDHQDLAFKNCLISNSDFSRSNLDRLRLENCRIFNCNFEKASIQEGYFEDCMFYEKDSQQGCNFNLADLRRAEFHRSNISMNTFKRANVFQLVIDECRAQGCDFQFANFVNVVSRTVLFSSATLIRSDFRYSNFEGVYLEKCDLSESKLVSVILSRANLEEADLTNTDFAPAEYDGLSIFKADMRNANIDNIDVRKLDFSGVKILDWQQQFFIENLGIVVFPDKMIS